MAPQPSELDRTFVNLTDDPAEGRGARRTYIRRAVMKNFHKQRSQKKKAMRHEAGATSMTLRIGQLDPGALLDWQPSPPYHAMLPKFSLFEQKRFSDPSMMQMSNFVLRYLYGQASKATHDICLVGFVHPFTEHEIESDSGDASMKLSALKTCQNLLRAYGSYKSNSLSLSVNKEELWEMIHQHQEWIYTKINTFTSWELLSAAQTVAIYVLLRIKLGENSAAFPNGDIALLYTLGAIFRRLHSENSLDLSHHPSGDWKQWVFVESFLRIATIYFTLNVIVSMEFGLPCNSPQDWNIDSMLLPASKVSWATQNTADWTKFTNGLPPYKQLTWNDLQAPAQALHDCPVEEWKEGSDELGMIVTMVMTLRAQAQRYQSPSSGSS